MRAVQGNPLTKESAMRVVQLSIHSSENATSIIIRVKNVSSKSLTLFAPDPYSSTDLFDENRKVHPRVRAITWKNSRKSIQIEPDEVVNATIDLKNYWSDIRGNALVVVAIELADSAGMSYEETAEGNVVLNIPSSEEKLAEIQRRRKTESFPVTLFDVSSSTQFTKLAETEINKDKSEKEES